MIPVIGTLKRWALMLLGLAMSLLAVFLAGRSAGRSKEREAAQKGARETERKATDAMIEGLEREQQAVEEARRTDPKRRDHFES